MKFFRSCKNSLFCLMVGLIATAAPLSCGVQKIESFHEVEPVFDQLEPGALVVLDIDEVTMTDRDAILRPEGDPLKFKLFNEYYSQAKNKKEREEIQKTLSLSLVLAQKKLIEKELPQIIDSLQKRKIKVIALTSCPTKSFGVIKDCEQWRLDHVKSFGIHFDRSFPSLKRFHLNEMSLDELPSPVYNKGIIFTEGFSKADVLISFMRKMNFKPTQVVFVDDMYRHVKDMNAKLSHKDIPHYEYHYQRVKNVEPTSLNERIARFQFDYLFKHKKWLNDREAQDKMISPDN